ncbi:c-type cytochrome [Cognatiluteimonas weifangensis]|uniref:Cytochrome c4 n=1 Tax=Cognatiluteimonas weifangensis TaxID=2303539 RepID=A0A372DQH2_9GAMM|nr:c-type cytochrome [Luteimonas weifangensis]RFP61810.1 cytochrome c4 [Luteimonas weifangensis]
MRHARAYGIAALATLALAAAAFAQTTVTPLPEAAPVQATPLDAAAVADLAKTHWGDAKAGATKAGACAACHGLDGNPTDPQYPRLAGMPERYTARQLALFKGGERTGGMAAVMVPMATPLSAQDMRDIGAYFAQQKAGAGIADDTVIAEGPNKGMKFYAVGQQLFLGGDPARGIPACMACHGPTGAGNPGPAYPHIGGQYTAYTTRRLEEYRTGTSSESDPRLFQTMAAVAKSLTDEEIRSLASYVQGLHPRSDEEATAAATTPVTAPAPAAEPAPAPAPEPAAPPPAPAPAQS